MIPNQRDTSETFTLCLTRAIRYKLHPPQWSKLEPHTVWCVDSVLSNSAILRTVACQALLSMGFRQQQAAVGCQVLLQGIFLTRCSNLYLLHCMGLFFATEPLRELIETLLKPKSFLRCFTTCFVWKQIWTLNKEAVTVGIFQ